jgi:hypothetical protein
LKEKQRGERRQEECEKAAQDKNRIYRLMQQKRRTRGVEEEYKRLRMEEKHTHQKKRRENIM